MAADVFVAGSLHLDVMVDAPRLPRLDETLVGQAVRYVFGGKGGNQAVAAARMGARTEMAGAVGTDSFADILLAALDEVGVDRSRVAQVPGASGMSVAITDKKGDYGAVIVSGANLRIDPAAAIPPKGTRVLVLQNEIPEVVNLAAAEVAARQGTRVILNAAPARPLPPALLAATSVLVVNRGEAAALSGLPATAPEEAAEAILAKGPDAVIVTLGAEGLLCCRRDGPPFAASAYPVTVVTTHGAGDAFTGALAAELASGTELSDAALFAEAAAALYVSTQPEDRTGITREAAEALAARG
ncbi:PfkB family carbohydrate kinase [Ostreiculturibacter nitratireducens]|uniref:PfkB family carbohydrate kinase n=1 Tax=Ostreiculturibacter nitratireducens TaxID=3075226 RepID=UPI0031B58DAF